MAEYIFLDIGAGWDLAFPFREAARVHHSFEEVFGQLREEAADLPVIFGKGGDDTRPQIILTMNDSSSFIAFDSWISDPSAPIDIYPLPPCLFVRGKVWARAVLKCRGRISFAVNRAVLKSLGDG